MYITERKEWREHLGPMPATLHIPSAPLLNSSSWFPSQEGENEGKMEEKSREERVYLQQLKDNSLLITALLRK